MRVEGGRGWPKTGTLKVSVGYLDGCVGEGQISYAGPGAVARGRLALEIVRERLALTGVAATETRFDLIGVDALHGPRLSGRAPSPTRCGSGWSAGPTASPRRRGSATRSRRSTRTARPAAAGRRSRPARCMGVVSALRAGASWPTPAVHWLEA